MEKTNKIKCTKFTDLIYELSNDIFNTAIKMMYSYTKDYKPAGIDPNNIIEIYDMANFCHRQEYCKSLILNNIRHVKILTMNRTMKDLIDFFKLQKKTNFEMEGMPKSYFIPYYATSALNPKIYVIVVEEGKEYDDEIVCYLIYLLNLKNVDPRKIHVYTNDRYYIPQHGKVRVSHRTYDYLKEIMYKRGQIALFNSKIKNERLEYDNIYCNAHFHSVYEIGARSNECLNIALPDRYTDKMESTLSNIEHRLKLIYERMEGRQYNSKMTDFESELLTTHSSNLQAELKYIEEYLKYINSLESIDDKSQYICTVSEYINNRVTQYQDICRTHDDRIDKYISESILEGIPNEINMHILCTEKLIDGYDTETQKQLININNEYKAELLKLYDPRKYRKLMYGINRELYNDFKKKLEKLQRYLTNFVKEREQIEEKNKALRKESDRKERDRKEGDRRDSGRRDSDNRDIDRRDRRYSGREDERDRRDSGREDERDSGRRDRRYSGGEDERDTRKRGSYYQKYLKYKQKYLLLKQKLNMAKTPQ